jgi:hypothetical protein
VLFAGVIEFQQSAQRLAQALQHARMSGTTILTKGSSSRSRVLVCSLITPVPACCVVFLCRVPEERLSKQHRPAGAHA